MPPQPARRALLAGFIALSAAISACTPASSTLGDPPVRQRGTVQAARDGSSGVRVMQILAHPDDDLYFMNPELQQSIDANDQLVSVYVTSGEAEGFNKIPGHKPPKPNVANYAGARRQGLRQAYAFMATGDTKAAWTRQAITLPDGTPIEVDALSQHPGIRLIFLGVSQHFSPHGAPNRDLRRLWEDPRTVTRTLVGTGSPVRASHTVTRTGLIDALVHLMDSYRPTLVRTMDPDPDMQVRNAKHRAHHDQRGYSDHPDHTAAALFTYAALDRYRAPHAVAAFRGYYNERWPQGLPAQIVRDKADVLNVYGGSPKGCDDKVFGGCGDYDVGRDRSYGTGWLQRTSLRYPTAAPQLRQGADGRLNAFAVLGGQAAMWQETEPGGGRWTAPKLLAGNGLLPGLTASPTRDGRWQLFAERVVSLGARAKDNRREIVMTEQTRQGGPFRAWVSLGTPDRDPEHGRRVGGPVVTRGADGTTWLFVRNWAKGVSVRSQRADGTWSDWSDLGGAEVQEGLSAVTDAKGVVHVFGAGHQTVRHWMQRSPGGPFVLVPTGLPAPADPPTALARPDGSLLLAFRAAGTARLLVRSLPAGGGAWRAERVDLGSRGYGALALHSIPGGVLLAARNNDGGTSLATLGTGRAPQWSTVPGAVVGAASLATDAANRPVLALLAPDATLRTRAIAESRPAEQGDRRREKSVEAASW
ncbi:PIG-L family deacetylase [Streptomyces melanogenes]|uniref:PIG-L family deacetylase n=1 Tax=Streptomyces melanogenes TaxID=67326 RepID=A0ABZ1XE62_9ACTN|nr:PIG-L family deacetylase [Streptomyces melanogenes]